LIGPILTTRHEILLSSRHDVTCSDPTIEDSLRKVDGRSYMLEVLDTAEEILRNQWIRDNECFLLIYSITSGEYDRIRRVKGLEYVTSTGDAGTQAY
jgi:hypothetical protein